MSKVTGCRYYCVRCHNRPIDNSIWRAGGLGSRLCEVCEAHDKRKKDTDSRFTLSKCDRCGKATRATQNGIGDLFRLPHEWGAPLADEGDFCERCITRFDQNNWLAWMAEHRPPHFHS